jgi:hypothetical protein
VSSRALPAAARDGPGAAGDQLVYVGAGPLLAVLLGFALIPFRESTTASNLSFAFVVLTVVVSAFGGRAAGVATALVSSLSMDFFLTRPYLSLRMHESHDVVAFLGLTACGLVAASLGSAQRIASLRELRSHAALLERTLAELEGAGPLDVELGRALERARQVLPVRALVLRDLSDRVVAAAPPRAGTEAVPGQIVEPATLLPRGEQEERLRGAPPLPPDGARLALTTKHRHVAWLDLWGDGAPGTAAARAALTAVARIAAVMVDRDAPR